MIATPVALDWMLVVLMILLSIVEWRWYWPRRVRAIAAGVPGTRARMYREIVAAEWVLTAAIVALWVGLGRPWGALLLGAASPPRLAIGIALASLLIALLAAQRRALLARPERLARVGRAMEHVDALVPATAGEHRGFAAVSLTAGLCEEFIYRGFVLGWAGAWGGPVAAVLVSSLVFGFGHLYQGPRHVLRIGALGVFFALLAMASGSLWPGILVHAAMDLASGDLGYRSRRAAMEIAGPAPA